MGRGEGEREGSPGDMPDQQREVLGRSCDFDKLGIRTWITALHLYLYILAVVM
jgi:hypothetical protein